MTRVGRPKVPTIVVLSLAAMLGAVPPDASRAVPFGAECRSFRPGGSFYAPAGSFTDPRPPAWPTVAPAAVGLDPVRLDAVANDAALSRDVASLLVTRHGKLAYERYFNGSTAAEANNVQSLSKSILSLLTGIAVADGTLALDTRLGDVLPPDLVGAHGDLTVENLLTMSGGLELDAEHEWAYDETPSAAPGEPSFVRAVLHRPSVAVAGTEFAYSTGLTQVLAAALTEATGRRLCEFAATRLLGPLGIDVEKWWVEPGGYDSGGHSLFLTPREIARLGQLVLQRGRWAGEQVVPATWLDASLRPRWDRGCPRPVRFHQAYGYLWWLYDVAGHQVWNASGNGGQELLVVADLDLVVVLTHYGINEDEGHQGVPGLALLEAVLGAFPGTEDGSCPRTDLGAFLVRPDGTGRHPVAGWPAGAAAFSWSRQGVFAVQSDRLDLNSEIYALDGGTLRRLTRDYAFDAMPAWSPDGSSVSFMRGSPTQSDLYRVRADGADLRRLTRFDGWEHSPAWSPDGSRIAFVRGHGDARGYGDDGELWTIDADGSHPARLLARRTGAPAWSPDGRRIAVELRDTGRIGVLDVASGAVTELRDGYRPQWSPDGTRLAFVADPGHGLDLYVMNGDGAGVMKLTDEAAYDTLPLWSPGGEWILFHSR